MPDSFDQNHRLFYLVNKYPVLFVNLQANNSFIADISKRFQNIYNKSCPLVSYKISRMINNSIQLNPSLYD